MFTFSVSYIVYFLFTVDYWDAFGTGLQEGDQCSFKDGTNGRCKFLTSCQPALESLKDGIFPQSICGFQGTKSIFCCNETGPVPTKTSEEINKQNVKDCLTPDGAAGGCISIKECTPIINFLKVASKPLSQDVIKELNRYTCSSEANIVKVCCPSTNVINIVEEATGKPQISTENPLPPDVTNHRNFNLLPKDCGSISEDGITINGPNASLNEFPWMALLSYSTKENGRQFQCGGSILNDKWILTAAHCVTPLKYPLLGVRVGEYDIIQKQDCAIQKDGSKKCAAPVQDLRVEKIVAHPEFNRNVISNDIALLKVTGMNLNVENVKPICLPVDISRDAKLNNVIVTGWRSIQEQPGILQKESLPVVSLDQCQSVYKKDLQANVTYKKICAGGKDGKDSCPGDGGGPVQVAAYINDDTRYVQQGIVSFGPRLCGLKGFPEVFTRVAYYMDWILDTIY